MSSSNTSFIVELIFQFCLKTTRVLKDTINFDPKKWNLLSNFIVAYENVFCNDSLDFFFWRKLKSSFDKKWKVFYPTLVFYPFQNTMKIEALNENVGIYENHESFKKGVKNFWMGEKTFSFKNLNRELFSE